jgi:hypothetical protein
MERKKKGLLGEAKVLTYFIENDYEVFLPFADNGPYDLLVVKDKQIQKVSVKSTSSLASANTWSVELRTVSRRKDNKTTVTKIDKQDLDLLAVYIIPEDRVIILDIKTIDSTSYVGIPRKVI